MLHEALRNGLNKFEKAISQCRHIYVERYTEEILTAERANLRIFHLKSFPSHKHVPHDVVSSEKPEFKQLLKEAEQAGISA